MKVFKDKFKDPESRNKRKRDEHPGEVGTNNGVFTSITCTNKKSKKTSCVQVVSGYIKYANNAQE